MRAFAEATEQAYRILYPYVDKGQETSKGKKGQKNQAIVKDIIALAGATAFSPEQKKALHDALDDHLKRQFNTCAGSALSNALFDPLSKTLCVIDLCLGMINEEDPYDPENKDISEMLLSALVDTKLLLEDSLHN